MHFCMFQKTLIFTWVFEMLVYPPYFKVFIIILFEFILLTINILVCSANSANVYFNMNIRVKNLNEAFSS